MLMSSTFVSAAEELTQPEFTVNVSSAAPAVAPVKPSISVWLADVAPPEIITVADVPLAVIKPLIAVSLPVSVIVSVPAAVIAPVVPPFTVKLLIPAPVLIAPAVPETVRVSLPAPVVMSPDVPDTVTVFAPSPKFEDPDIVPETVRVSSPAPVARDVKAAVPDVLDTVTVLLPAPRFTAPIVDAPEPVTVKVSAPVPASIAPVVAAVTVMSTLFVPVSAEASMSPAEAPLFTLRVVPSTSETVIPFPVPAVSVPLTFTVLLAPTIEMASALLVVSMVTVSETLKVLSVPVRITRAVVCPAAPVILWSMLIDVPVTSAAMAIDSSAPKVIAPVV